MLGRARELNLILVSHDSRTMYFNFANFLLSLQSDEQCPGVFLVSQERYSIGQIVGFILEIYDLSGHSEWQNRIVRLSL